MPKSRLEAFSDGVFAIIITIMVLELRAPHETDISALRPLLPVFLSYVLSFLYIGIYWNNHHHMLHTAHKISGGILWANLHLLFWISLFPFVTEWAGEHHADKWPTAFYGIILCMAAVAYWILQNTIIAHQGHGSILAKAIGRDAKGKGSIVIYAVAVGATFINVLISQVLYLLVALMWLVPDRRIERMQPETHDASH